MREVLVAVFETTAQAQSARLALTNAGVEGTSIREIGSTSERKVGTGGFWSWLTGEESTATVGAGTTAPTGASWRDAKYRDEDERLITEAVSRGHTVLAVHVDDTNVERVIQVLADQHPVSLEDTPVETTGSVTGAVAPVTGAATTVTGAPTTETLATGVSSASRLATETEETIPLAEEQVEIGKRQVTRPVRVRRYVVERPVEEQVTLRDERVEIERRRPIEGTTPDAGVFEERVVEVHETTEVPVVEKTARVAEEVVVRRESGERVETVHETVRKEEVEVDRDQTPKKP